MRKDILSASILFFAASLAAADPVPSAPSSSQASVEYAVERSGGGYEVTVSPTFVTVFYLPERVTKAIASNQRDFQITLLQDTVVVKPMSDKIGLTANLNIETRKLHISVILKVGEPKVAVPQLIFTRAKEKAEIDRKVEQALAPLRSDLEEKERAFGARVQAAAEEAIAEAMAKDFVLNEMDAVVRNDANVVARVPRAVRIGAAVYVQLSVQNRSSRPYLLGRAVAAQDKRELPARLSFSPRDGNLGKVEPGQRGRGVLVIPAAELHTGRPFEVRLIEEPGGNALALSGLRAP